MASSRNFFTFRRVPLGKSLKLLQAGDSNTKFFFSAMKERYSKNSINVLYDNAGKKLTTTEEIKGEVSCFYKNLIGTPSSSLTSIDVNIMRRGKQLSADVVEALVQPVLDSEIYCTQRN